MKSKETAFPVIVGSTFHFSGLTKREYIATHMLASRITFNYTTHENVITEVLELTDKLLKKLSETK